jgi:hypothetical protein
MPMADQEKSNAPTGYSPPPAQVDLSAAVPFG